MEKGSLVFGINTITLLHNVSGLSESKCTMAQREGQENYKTEASLEKNKYTFFQSVLGQDSTK